MLLPPVKKHVIGIKNLQRENTEKDSQLQLLQAILENSRSPGLISTENDSLTERLLSHPALHPLPPVKIGSTHANPHSNRLSISERLLRAYHKSIKDESTSILKREKEDLWTGLIRNELPDLIKAIEKNDAKGLSDFLLHFTTEIWI